MKKEKTKKELEAEGIKLYGSLNKKNPPFNVGDKLQQIYRLDDNDDIVEDGRELHEFVGMKGDLMLIKCLNEAALYGYDTCRQEIVNHARKAGYKPILGNIRQLHYMYADRFKVIP